MKSSALPLAAVDSLSDSEETLHSKYEINLFDFKPVDASALPTDQYEKPFEKSPVAQPLNKFPIFYETRRFITVFTTARHWSLS
jgi:hypothetical protein